MHLQRPHITNMVFLEGTHVFALELEGNEMMIWNVEKGYKVATQARNFHLHLKRDLGQGHA